MIGSDKAPKERTVSGLPRYLTELCRHPSTSPRALPILLLLPALAVLFVTIAYPLLQTIVVSVYRYELTRPKSLTEYVFLAHYKTLALDKTFWFSFGVSGLYTGTVTSVSFVLGLGLALLLNYPSRGLRLARVLLAIPWAIPRVVAALDWRLMFDATYGPVNYLILLLGLSAEPITWLVRPTPSLCTILSLAIWTIYPFNMLVLLAGLQSIPSDLYEAAEIDGANAWAQFRWITWPGIRFVSEIAIVLTAVVTFRDFESIYLLTEGGPNRSTETLSVNVYVESFQYFHFGYASAIGVIMLMISLCFSLVFLRLMRAEGE
jgi:ABC-type sugar transport system permease subunit